MIKSTQSDMLNNLLVIDKFSQYGYTPRSAIRDPRSAIRDPRSAIRDPKIFVTNLNNSKHFIPTNFTPEVLQSITAYSEQSLAKLNPTLHQYGAPSACALFSLPAEPAIAAAQSLCAPSHAVHTLATTDKDPLSWQRLVVPDKPHRHHVDANRTSTVTQSQFE